MHFLALLVHKDSAARNKNIDFYSKSPPQAKAQQWDLKERNHSVLLEEHKFDDRDESKLQNTRSFLVHHVFNAGTQLMLSQSNIPQKAETYWLAP